MAFLNQQSVKVFPHHKKDVVCPSRAKYRDGRKDTAVKVYTVNQESVYLLIQGVPAVGAQNELEALCEQYGEIDYIKPLDEYPCEEFTEVYVVKYRCFPAARTAKKHLDDKSFFGGNLHVCYAPEFETVSDTREKLQERRKYVAWKTRSDPEAKGTVGQHKVMRNKPKLNEPSSTQLRGEGVNPVSGNTDATSCEPVTYIWAGKQYTVYPQPSGSSSTEQYSEPSLESSPSTVQTNNASQPFLPRQLRTGTQKTPDTITKDSKGTSSNFYGDCANETKFTSSACPASVNQGTEENSFSSSTESIKRKLLGVAVPNVRVSSKCRRRI